MSVDGNTNKQTVQQRLLLHTYIETHYTQIHIKNLFSSIMPLRPGVKILSIMITISLLPNRVL